MIDATISIDGQRLPAERAAHIKTLAEKVLQEDAQPMWAGREALYLEPAGPLGEVLPVNPGR
jgi:hypothetical protein